MVTGLILRRPTEAPRVTIRCVTAREFGKELRRRRDAQQVKRPALERMSGVSEDTIAKWESKNPPRSPDRGNVINVVRALDWEPNEALTLLGYRPMDEDERRFIRPPADPWEDLARMWPRLSGVLQEAIVRLVASVLQPQRPASNIENRSDEPDPATRHHKHVLGTPGEPSRSVDGHDGNDYDPGLIEPS